MSIEKKIDEAIAWAEKEMKNPSYYGFLPDIVGELKAIKANLNDPDECKIYAKGLGYLTLDNYDFSESELGTLLGEIADYFLPPAEDAWK